MPTTFRLFLHRQRKRILLASLLSLALLLLALWCANRVIARRGSRVFGAAVLVPEGRVGLLLGTNPKAQGRSNQYFTARVAAAAQLYTAGKLRAILISGDNGRDDYNEPQAMQEALLRRGVPAEAIYLDYAGFSTLDSVARAKLVFGLTKVTIITQRAHCERALYLADHHGMDAVGFAAGEVSGLLTLRIRARESLARLKALLDIHLLHAKPKFLGRDPYGLGRHESW